jgi:hypothetical protein
MRKLFDGWRSLNWDFWRYAFPKDPRTGSLLVWLVVVVFFADCLWFVLTPKEVRKQQGYGG